MDLWKVGARENRDELKKPFHEGDRQDAPHFSRRFLTLLSVYMHGDQTMTIYVYMSERIRIDHVGHDGLLKRSSSEKKRDI